MKAKFLVFLILSMVSAGSAFAQTNEFTYQGRLNDDSMPANAAYDFRFGLWTAAINGIPLATRERFGVTVTDGSFTVTLDFPAANFTGLDRYLEIAVKPAGGGSYTTLTPRQRITSSPYSIRSLNSTTADTATNATTATTATNSNQLGGVAANQYVQTTDPRMTNARNPLPGSTEYIQNNSGFPQTGNFAISGNGLIGGNALVSGSLTVNGTASANIFNAATQFNLGGIRFLHNGGTQNTFAGVNTGLANTTGTDNTFVGYVAGDASTGSNNSFVGSDAGGSTTSGSGNTFVGSDAGDLNSIGGNNTALGNGADVGSNNLTFATAIGAGATVTASSRIVLGRSQGEDEVLIPGVLRIVDLSGGGINSVCSTSGSALGGCVSSIRYKSNIHPFNAGLTLINRLRPVSFNWKDGGMADLGLAAEDVAEIEPLLVTYNKQGQVEGVKYDRIGVVLVNAVKEQQSHIEAQAALIKGQQGQLKQHRQVSASQQAQIDVQKLQINALKAALCQMNPKLAVCTRSAP